MYRSSSPPSAAPQRFDFADAALAATLVAASMGAIWDLASGHVAVFDKLLLERWDDGQ